MNSIQKRVWSQVCSWRLVAVVGLVAVALFGGAGSAQACKPSKDGAPAMPWMQDQDSSNWQPSIVGEQAVTRPDTSPEDGTSRGASWYGTCGRCRHSTVSLSMPLLADPQVFSM